MTEVPASESNDGDARHRRNALVFAAASVLSGTIAPIGIVIQGLAGSYLLDADKSLATLPVSFYIVGVAIGAIPAALVMERTGRRAGFMIGAVVAALGGLASGWSVLAASFAGLVAGSFVLGLGGSFAQQYRFAAADAGSAAFRARAISWVLGGGIIAAVLGPQTLILTRHLFDPIPFVGGFFAMSVFALLGLGVLTLLDGQARVPVPRAMRSGGRPLGEIVRQPRFLVALVCAVSSYALMSLLMTAAPLAMIACGLGEANAALGIQWHVLAMFGPSFFTGAIIARLGQELVVGIGMALLAACAVIGLAGIDVANFWAALILLGLGWNFGFIGATAMLTETYRPEEKAKVQGVNDFLLFGVVAIASFSSGKVFASIGWGPLNLFAFPIVLVCVVALALTLAGRRRAVA